MDGGFLAVCTFWFVACQKNFFTSLVVCLLQILVNKLYAVHHEYFFVNNSALLK